MHMPSGPLAEAGHWRRGKLRSLGRHRNAGIEIVYIAGGRSRWHVDGHVEAVWPQSVFFTLPWQEHGSVSMVEEGLELYWAVLRLDREYLQPQNRITLHPGLRSDKAFERGLSGELIGTKRNCYAATAPLGWLMPRLCAEASSQSPDATAIASLAMLVLVELRRSIHASRTADRTTHAGQARVAAFMERVSIHCALPWTLDRMANECGLARTRFSELVRQATGDSPIMALNRLRIARAKELITRGRMSLTEIAHATGFSSSQYFARVFRSYTGQSASDFRRATANPAAERVNR
jgi:AraC-like DNA-binding protein